MLIHIYGFIASGDFKAALHGHNVRRQQLLDNRYRVFVKDFRLMPQVILFVHIVNLYI